MRVDSVRCGLAAVALLLVLTPVLSAQIEEEPGYFPIDRFGILDSDALSLEINLDGGLLGIVAAALGEDEPEFAELVKGLKGIRVRVAEENDLDSESLQSGLAEASDWLQEHGWSTLMRMHEDDEEVYVYVRQLDGEIVGMTLLAVEAEESVVVNIVGRIDLALMATLAESLDIPQLDIGDEVSDEEESTEDPR
jgi:hypothetical protein